MILAQLHLTLPPWVHDEVDADRSYPDADSRVDFVVHPRRQGQVQLREDHLSLPSSPTCRAA